MVEIEQTTVDENVFQIVEKNGKYHVIHNGNKICERAELVKAIAEYDKISEPFLRKWYKERGIEFKR